MRLCESDSTSIWEIAQSRICVLKACSSSNNGSQYKYLFAAENSPWRMDCVVYNRQNDMMVMKQKANIKLERDTRCVCVQPYKSSDRNQVLTDDLIFNRSSSSVWLLLYKSKASCATTEPTLPRSDCTTIRACCCVHHSPHRSLFFWCGDGGAGMSIKCCTFSDTLHMGLALAHHRISASIGEKEASSNYVTLL